MSDEIPLIDEVLRAESVVHRHIEATPLVRSYALERELDLPPTRRVWLKDFGWTPTGSFKVYGALNWVHKNLERIGDRPIAAQSSGNFASGISYAGNRFGKRVIILMPDNAPEVKFRLTRSFGAEIRTYDIANDHLTGDRDRMTDEITNEENAVQASPYDDLDLIAGHGVGAMEIVHQFRHIERTVSTFICPVSGGGLMSGHAIAMAHRFPDADIVGVEPELANDFSLSLQQGERVRVDRPQSICDGLLSYDVGKLNWPILRQLVGSVSLVPDADTQAAMRWLYEQHGLRSEPSGSIALAALLTRRVDVKGEGDIVVVISGRNVDDEAFRRWIAHQP